MRKRERGVSLSLSLSLACYPFPLKFSISSHPGCQDATINATLVHINGSVYVNNIYSLNGHLESVYVNNIYTLNGHLTRKSVYVNNIYTLNWHLTRKSVYAESPLLCPTFLSAGHCSLSTAQSHLSCFSNLSFTSFSQSTKHPPPHPNPPPLAPVLPSSPHPQGKTPLLSLHC